MFHRVAIIDNGIGQVQRLNYLGDIQMKIEQGNSLVTTVCMECVGWVGHMFYRADVIDNGSFMCRTVERRHGQACSADSRKHSRSTNVDVAALRRCNRVSIGLEAWIGWGKGK